MLARIGRTMVCVLLIGASCAIAQNWPQWRGPQACGLAPGKNLPAEWGQDKNIAWKVALPGKGWSQPIVWGNKIFVTTAVTEHQTKPEAGNFNPMATADGPASSGSRFPGGPGGFPGPGGPGRGFGPPPPPPDKLYSWKLICLDGVTGNILWDKTAREGKPRATVNQNNTYASETPATDGEHVIAYFGNTGLYCYDVSGNLVWSKDLGVYPMQLGWGTGSSPLLYAGRVFIQCDNDQKSFLVALDKKTGDELWRVDRDEKSNWSTPYVWKNKQRTELITAGGAKLRSQNPDNGEILWEMGGAGRNSLTPVSDQELLYADSVDRMMGGRGPIVAIRAGASGDISLKDGETSNAFVAWSSQLRTFRVASPLLYEGCLYLLDQQRGQVRCYDAKTGKEYYSERLEGAKGFTSSPWANDGKVFCLDETGLTVVLKAGPKLEVVTTNKLDEMCWSSVAAMNESLLLRGVDHLYCIAK
jgi:outer membrane protein assembly factor BamB